MILVDAQNITVERPGKPLFTDASVTISSGDRIGVVGLNGAGKSTLLQVLTGAVDADSGAVRTGRSVSISTLAQTPELPDGPARAALGDSWEADAVLDRLGMAAKAQADVASLSGGERRRVALAQALVTDTDLLVLDEPTNHLDIDAIDWLEERLAQHNGGLLLVTHDRHLLDRVTTRILEVDRGAIWVHEGGYASYLEGKAQREAAAETAEAVRQNLARREQEWLRRGAPARTRKSKAHIARAEAIIAQPNKTEVRGDPLPLHHGTPRLGDQVLELRGVGARVGDRVLFSGLDLTVGRRERLGIVGPNGAGKSTLLDIMAQRRAPDEGTVLVGATVALSYFDQLGKQLDPKQRLRDAMTDGRREPDWRDTALLERFWFEPETQWAPISMLSGGERRRFQLVLSLREQPNVLLLDEPTNDLDIDTLRSLEDFLEDWPGALIVVSHDRAFLERTVDDIVVIDDGAASRYRGGVEAWVAQRRAGRRRGHATQGEVKDPARSEPKRPTKSSEKSPPSVRSASTIRHDIKQAEKRIAKLEKQRNEMTATLETTTEHAALADLGARLATVQADLDEAEEQWLVVSAELEDR